MLMMVSGMLRPSRFSLIQEKFILNFSISILTKKKLERFNKKVKCYVFYRII